MKFRKAAQAPKASRRVYFSIRQVTGGQLALQSFIIIVIIIVIIIIVVVIIIVIAHDFFGQQLAIAWGFSDVLKWSL